MPASKRLSDGFGVTHMGLAFLDTYRTCRQDMNNIEGFRGWVLKDAVRPYVYRLTISAGLCTEPIAASGGKGRSAYYRAVDLFDGDGDVTWAKPWEAVCVRRSGFSP